MTDPDLDMLLAYVSTHYLAPPIKAAYDRLRRRAVDEPAEARAALDAVRAELAAVQARNRSDAPYF